MMYQGGQGNRGGYNNQGGQGNRGGYNNRGGTSNRGGYYYGNPFRVNLGRLDG